MFSDPHIDDRWTSCNFSNCSTALSVVYNAPSVTYTYGFSFCWRREAASLFQERGLRAFIYTWNLPSTTTVLSSGHWAATLWAVWLRGLAQRHFSGDKKKGRASTHFFTFPTQVYLSTLEDQNSSLPPHKLTSWTFRQPMHFFILMESQRIEDGLCFLEYIANGTYDKSTHQL